MRFILQPSLQYMEIDQLIDRQKAQRVTEKIMKMVTQGRIPSVKEIKQKKKKKRYKRKEKQLTPEQIEVFKQAFQIFDTDHSGNIDHSQLTSLLEALGFSYDEKEIQGIFDEVDDDGSGVIEVTEFIKFMSMQILDTENLKMQILKVFRHFDDDNSGFLDVQKIKSMLEECFFNLGEEDINNMIAAADTDGDGKINQYQFLRLMKKVKLI